MDTLVPMTMATRYVGTCSVCEREQRVRKGLMVLHGYVRPGHGWIQGSCPGTGWPPYEISAAGTQNYRRMTEVSLRQQEDLLERDESGRTTSIEVEVGKSAWRAGEFKTLTAQDGPAFTRAVERRIAHTQYEIRKRLSEIERATQLIMRWQPATLTSFEEAQHREERSRAERTAERDAAKAARMAKRQALDAKRDAREQEKQALLNEYRQIFNELAFSAASPGILETAKQHWIAMHRRKSKKAYLDFWESELGIDEALLALKLAMADTRRPGRYHYANDLGWEPR